MELNWLKVAGWERYPGLLHGFLGRQGGKSTGPYAGLNLSFRVGDEPAVVKDNICDMKKAVGIHDARIIMMQQVHGDDIVEVRERNIKEVGVADGMYTAERQVYLAVLTADCAPILFVAPARGVVAVVHAGWRGTLMGIAAKAVRLFRERYGTEPEEVEAAIGPTIGACCYEVKADVTRPMMENWGELARPCVREENGGTFLDLKGLNAAILQSAGLPSGQIHRLGPCTSCTPREFYSFRRERKETGRQISFIGWQRP